MTFESRETSVADGQPVELLKVTYASTSWFYTNTESPITYESDEYVPFSFKHDNIQPVADASRASLTISVAQDSPIGDLFRIQPPSGLVIVTLFGHHLGDSEFVVQWKGRVTTVDHKEPWLELTVENVFSSLQRPGLRRRWSAQCPLALYNCGVVRADYKEDYVVESISGYEVICLDAIGKDDDYFAGGYAEWTHDTRGTIERQMISTSNGTTGALTFISALAGLVDAADIDVYPGCDHSITTCDTKFDNSANYGGQPFIPTKNPFGGSIIY
jgi:uncharacterized phage protein (TIGR02218 family)